jgi:hypothetical protein
MFCGIQIQKYKSDFLELIIRKKIFSKICEKHENANIKYIIKMLLVCTFKRS